MTDEEIETTTTNKDNSNTPVDLEFEHYIFEVYLNDRIENEIQRMMEFSCTSADDGAL